MITLILGFCKECLQFGALKCFLNSLKLNDRDFYTNIIIDAALTHQMQETKPSRLSAQPLSLKADLYHLLEQVPRRSDL